MVSRRFRVRHHNSNFDVNYDTDDGFEFFKIQLFSLTSIPPEEQKIYGGEDDSPVFSDEDLVTISEKLRLVSINHLSGEESSVNVEQNAESMKADEELARLLQAEEEALMLQQYVASQDTRQFEGRIRPFIDQVPMYEDSSRQEAARRTVPVDELQEKGLVSLAKEGNFKPSKIEQDHAFLLQLLFWFKSSFRWVHSPSCHSCGNKTVVQGTDTPLHSESLYRASRVELYRLWKQEKVVVGNGPIALRSISCLVLDFTDHVWTECFSESLGRWMHIDPCEGVYDKPLSYEKGWNKKLNYVIAIAKDGVYDVTKRYTRKWHEVLSRRNIIMEPALSSVLADMRKHCRGGFTSQLLSMIEERDMIESQELERCLHSEDDVSLSLTGRRSGDEEWRKSRLEIGSDKNSTLSSSSCPVRLCVDDHVTRIYDAFLPMLNEFVREELTKADAVEILWIMKGIFLALRNSPFKTRRASADSIVNNTKFQKLLLSFDELFAAVSLERQVNTDGRVEICLAGDPVRTSLALPVVLDALDDMVCNLNKCERISEDSIAFPLLKSNRIHSGSVIASAEELPFGIATSAFDGTQKSKWEEPNGAGGCWIVYKTSDDKMYELEAYELMSANDAQERDPMNWILEGSNDGGMNWHVM